MRKTCGQCEYFVGPDLATKARAGALAVKDDKGTCYVDPPMVQPVPQPGGFMTLTIDRQVKVTRPACGKFEPRNGPESLN